MVMLNWDELVVLRAVRMWFVGNGECAWKVSRILFNIMIFEEIVGYEVVHKLELVNVVLG